MKKSIEDVDLHGKRVLLRADFNVPLENGQITDDYRIKMTIPTINYLLDHNVRSLHIISHLGRPKGYQKELSLEPVYQHIKQIFQNRGYKLEFRKFYEEPAQYTLFENIRFLDEETSCQNLDQFQNYVGANADILVIDAFGVVHRKGASITETKLQAYAGLLLKKELDAVKLFDKKFDLIILGGKKVDDKILLVKNCIKKCKKIYLGGGMCKPFIEGTLVEEINEIKRIAQEHGTEILLPMDFVIGKDDKYANTNQYNSALVDIGQESITKLVDEIKGAKSVFWNGPVGIFEVDGSSKGTQAVVQALKDVETSIIGGGDTASAISKFGKIEKYTHVSTGGGSLLALIEGRKLPGIDVIEES